MAVLGRYVKQPVETETYSISYKDDLTKGDGLVTAEASVQPVTDPPLNVFNVSHDDTRVRVWVRGGLVGTKYKIDVTVNTGDGRVLQDEFYVKIKES